MSKLIIPTYQTGFARHAAESRAPDLWRGLVAAYLPFLGPTGLTLRDWSGYQHHGTLTNMALTDWTISGEGMSLAFDMDGGIGTYDYINTGTYCHNPQGTIVWMQYPHTAFDEGVIHGLWGESNGESAPTLEFQLYSNGDIYAGFYNTGQDSRVIIAATAANWPQYEWSIYAFTWQSGGYTRLYHRGIEIGNNGGGTIVQTNMETMRIGHRGSRLIADVGFDGQIGFFLVYNRALYASELMQQHTDPYAMWEVARRPIWKAPVVSEYKPQIMMLV